MREGNKLMVSLKGINSVTEMVDANTIVNVSRTTCLGFLMGLLMHGYIMLIFYFACSLSDHDSRCHCLQED